MDKKGLNMEFIFVSIFLVAVLLFSAFMVLAYPDDSLLNKYLENAAVYSAPYSDNEIIDLIDQALLGLDDNSQEILSGFNDDDFLNIARGTDRGLVIIDNFSDEEISVANSLLFVILSEESSINNNDESVESLVFNIWKKTPKKTTKPPAPPKCPAKPGPCSPTGGVTCAEWINPYSMGACEYTCSSAGTWTPTLVCASGWCHGQNCL